MAHEILYHHLRHLVLKQLSCSRCSQAVIGEVALYLRFQTHFLHHFIQIVFTSGLLRIPRLVFLNGSAVENVNFFGCLRQLTKVQILQ